YIWTFMAGATYIVARVANKVVVNISSPRPFAILLNELAVAGAIIAISAQSAKSICAIFLGSFSSNVSVYTGFLDNALKVIGETNSHAFSVIMTRTSAPACVNLLVKSHAL